MNWTLTIIPKVVTFGDTFGDTAAQLQLNYNSTTTLWGVWRGRNFWVTTGYLASRVSFPAWPQFPLWVSFAKAQPGKNLRSLKLVSGNIPKCQEQIQPSDASNMVWHCGKGKLQNSLSRAYRAFSVCNFIQLLCIKSCWGRLFANVPMCYLWLSEGVWGNYSW